MFNFEKLIAYQETKKLVVDVYELTEKIYSTESDVVKKEIKKTVLEVPCAIAEGMSLATTNEKIKYLDVAYCKIARVHTLLQMAAELRYIAASELETISDELLEVSKVVLGLKRKLKGDSYAPREEYTPRVERTEETESSSPTDEFEEI